MTYLDLFLYTLINFFIGIGIWSFFSKKFCWYDPLFLSVVYHITKVLCTVYVHDKGLGNLLSIPLTILLYVKVFIPITYPKKEAAHESDINH